MKNKKSVTQIVVENWERVFFSIIGTWFIVFSIVLIVNDRVPNASIVFGLGFLCFIYANVSRFKKFKGLGFEAELWEDTKKEAEGLINRLRDVVSIYSREAILNRVKEGRWSEGPEWEKNWKLYDDLIEKHTELGQKIDFSEVKHTVDNYFLSDMIYPIYEEIRKNLFNARSAIDEKIREEFGHVIKDSVGHSARLAQVHEIRWELKENLFDALVNGDNIAKTVLSFWEEAKFKLNQNFDINVELDIQTLNRLKSILSIIDNRPVLVTQELIDWASPHDQK